MSKVIRTFASRLPEWRLTSWLVGARYRRLGTRRVFVAAISPQWLREFEVASCKETPE